MLTIKKNQDDHNDSLANKVFFIINDKECGNILDVFDNLDLSSSSSSDSDNHKTKPPLDKPKADCPKESIIIHTFS